MASFLSFLLGEKKKTASVAKERLQIILAHERNDDLKVHLERQDNLEVLEVKIELPDTVR